MTHNQAKLRWAEQVIWFTEKPRDIWVWEQDYDVVGYAYLSDRDGKTWISLAVHPDHQGQGIGTCIYARFFDVWAEIRTDNIASLRAAEKAGYTVVHSDDEKVVMHS